MEGSELQQDSAPCPSDIGFLTFLSMLFSVYIVNTIFWSEEAYSLFDASPQVVLLYKLLSVACGVFGVSSCIRIGKKKLVDLKIEYVRKRFYGAISLLLFVTMVVPGIEMFVYVNFGRTLYVSPFGTLGKCLLSIFVVFCKCFLLYYCFIVVRIFFAHNFISNCNNEIKEQIVIAENAELAGVDRVVVDLKNRIAYCRRAQFVLICSIVLTLIVGSSAFYFFLGSSTLSEVVEVCSLINQNKITRMLKDRPYDDRVAIVRERVNKIIEISERQDQNLRKNVLPESERQESFQIKLALKDIVAQRLLDGVATQTESSEYDRSVKEFKELFENLQKSIDKKSLVDWERILVRIALTAITVFIIQLFFSAYRYISKEMFRLQDQITAITVASSGSEVSINNAVKLSETIARNAVSYDSVPTSIIEKLLETIKCVGNSKST